MNMRKITSMTMFVSLFVLILNSIILYIVPQGRVAYWADWHLMGLSKTEWGDQHITVGFLFLISSTLHMYYNWKPIVAYMKNKAKEVKVFTPSFSVAFVVTALVVVGTYYPVPPMSTVIDFGEAIKDRGAEKYGEPPFGHAELASLKMFTKKEGLDLEKSLELLQGAGLQVEGEKDTLASIAKRNGLTPQGVYEVIQQAEKKTPKRSKVTMPDHPAPGFGKKSLAKVCEEYELNSEKIIKGLQSLGVTANSEMTIKDIASSHGKEPYGLYEMIYSLVMKSPK